MRLPFTERQRELITRVLNPITVVCGVSSLALLVVVIGWPLEADMRILVRASTNGVLAVFVGQEVMRLLTQANIVRFLRERFLEVTLALAAGVELLFGEPILHWLGDRAPDLPATTVTVLYLAGTQLTLVLLTGLRALRRNSLLSGRRLSPGMVFILSFAVLIALGTLLLKTPQATPVAGISWADATFTATSAVCVTGLSTVDMATTFTPHGQWIILGLIQIGGLGVMTITYFFAYFFAGGVSLRNRIALQDLLCEENLGHIGTVLGVIIGFTMVTEFIGALLIHASLSSAGLPADDLVFFSIFHSISAFCNAGFSTLSAGLADPAIAGKTGFFSIIMILIIGGGIGFPVIKNLWMVAIGKLSQRLGFRTAVPPRLTTNSHIVLITTIILIAGGALLIWFTEFVFGHGSTNGPEWFTALFHSVTARTAGFNITPTGGLLPATAATIMFLMFVGGSPSSTAGGIKTSTVAVAMLALRRVLLGRTDIEVYGRRFSEDIANRALAIILVTVGFITMVTIAVCALHPELSPADLTFEAVSAVSTVGLSRGITGSLGDPAKWVLIAAMFIGRIGVLLFLLSFIRKRQPVGYRLPETSIVLT
ncbi:MAG: potassium transporter TrkG [Opitutaceae bacterium]|jgi:Trk-type K+ transport system membrane component